MLLVEAADRVVTSFPESHLDLMAVVEPVVLTYCPACARQFDGDDMVWRLDGRAAAA